MTDFDHPLWHRLKVDSLKRPAWCMLGFGLIVSLVLFFWLYRYQQNFEQSNFERRAQFRVAAVQNGLTNATGALQVVNQLFATNGSVSREQFHSFTEPLRSRYPYIEAFAFQQVVLSDERSAFEAQMRTRYPGFTIDELVDGTRFVAAKKERYHVVVYREPMARNEAAFGLDASSQPFQDASRRAGDTGLASATGLFQLFKDRGEQRGFRILMAVYQGGTAPDAVAARRPAVIGYTVAVLRSGDLLKKILASVGSSGNAGLDIRIYAAASADESKLVYGPAAEPAGARAKLFESRPKPYARTIDVAGTTWQMLISAQPAPFVATHDSALLVLAMGLMITFAATAYLQSSAVRFQRIRQLVAQRTDELKQVNALLNEDILARKQAEQALVSNEERSRELAELSSDWFWEQDEHFRCTSYSSGAIGKGGPPAPLMLGATLWEVSVDRDASNWPAHRALLEAHLPFKNFEFKTLIDGKCASWLSSSGMPLFDAHGQFKGYRGTDRNISVRKSAEEALRYSRTELRNLANHQECARESERKRIARDIHDDLGQNLMVLRMDVSMMAARFDSRPVTKEWLEATLQHIDATIKSVRVIINDLRPAVLNLGLHAAVKWQVKEFELRSGIVCELHVDPDELALDDRCATSLYRIAQEALANILRHARARHVLIEIRQKDDALFMMIADDGIGIASAGHRKANSFGLVGIEERILALGGKFSVTSNPGEGMALMLSVPVDASAIPELQVTPEHV